jgi:hypothetical protein
VNALAIRYASLALLLCSAHADAAEPVAEGATDTASANANPMSQPSWRTGPSRWFASTTIDFGALYLRPRGALGYGKPQFAWVGIEANPIIAREMWGGYAGVRVSIPHFDVRFGARYFSAFSHDFVPALASVDRLTLESQRAGARGVTAESEINGQIPAGSGEILLLGSVSYVMGVPNGKYVFEETLRLIVAPPWVLRGRAGYAFHLGTNDPFSLGVVTDVLVVPERRTSVVRAGVLLRLTLSPNFEVRGTFVPRVFGPDRIGLLDSDFTELGLRWREATR